MGKRNKEDRSLIFLMILGEQVTSKQNYNWHYKLYRQWPVTHSTTGQATRSFRVNHINMYIFLNSVYVSDGSFHLQLPSFCQLKCNHVRRSFISYKSQIPKIGRT